MFIDQKLIFLCISEELGLLMDWVIYFVYHYVDLLIIYQLYAPDLGIQSWICINRCGRSWQAFYLSISIINRIHITKPGHKEYLGCVRVNCK